MNKKILIIIPGKLEFYKKENYNLIKEFFRNFDVNFFIIGWKNQDEKIIENFKKTQKLKIIKNNIFDKNQN